MSRRGKIARLPRDVREELNRRIEDGEEGASLVAWLNSLRAVQKVLKEKFGGREINDQNVSAWRQGGYQDWLVHQEIVAQVEQLAEDAEDLEKVKKPLTEHLATLVAVRYAEVLTNPNHEPEEQWERKMQTLRSLCREVIELRKSDQNAARLAMEQQRWAFERKGLNEKEQENERSKARAAEMAPYDAQVQQSILAKVHGQKGAARVAEIMHDLPRGTVCYEGIEEDYPAWKAYKERKAKAALDKAKASESNAGEANGESSLIKPNQGLSRPPKQGESEHVFWWMKDDGEEAQDENDDEGERIEDGEGVDGEAASGDQGEGESKS